MSIEKYLDGCVKILSLGRVFSLAEIWGRWEFLSFVLGSLSLPDGRVVGCAFLLQVAVGPAEEKPAR